jgi:NAD(P)-dependent dehydrogenase (short-subunit alcohol dehydrogenase family)
MRLIYPYLISFSVLLHLDLFTIIEIMNSNTHTENELSGKIALVTGGTKGIGYAIVKRLKQSGATAVTAARSIPAFQASDLFIQADLSTAEGVKKVVKEISSRLGPLDILIHNLGGSSAPSGGALVLSDHDWQLAFNTNLFAAVLFGSGFSACHAGK